MRTNYDQFDDYNVDEYEQAQEIYVPELKYERKYWERYERMNHDSHGRDLRHAFPY